jgi:hypothetical protein
MTPFFVALNMNQFELASILVPSRIVDMNTCEYCLLIDKMNTGTNPLTLDTAQNKAKIKELQDWLDGGLQRASQDFPILQLFVLLPEFALDLIKTAEA